VLDNTATLNRGTDILFDNLLRLVGLYGGRSIDGHA
jgi:hypothetical protein